MQFGAFDEKNLFHIEESRIYKNMSSGIKTVEFILKYNEQSIIHPLQRSLYHLFKYI